MDCKNFAKALDHQGIHFKASDRKAISVKSLVTEIEALQREQREKKSNLANRYQFDFIFKNSEVFFDVENVILNYIDGNMTISQNDEERIVGLVKYFLPNFFQAEDVDAVANGDSVDVQAMEIDDPLITDAELGTHNIRKRSTFTFYANTAIYALFRLYQVIFD